MTRLQRFMAAWACVGMLIGPAGECWAADPPAKAQDAPRVGVTASVPEQHLDLTYIPASAFIAVVAHPQAVLTAPGAEIIPTEVITAGGMKEVGFDPLKIKEAVLLFAPPSGRPHEFENGVVIRFIEPYSAASVTISRFARGGTEIDVDGRKVFERPGGPSFCFPDDRTIILGTPGIMRQMLSAKDAESPLLTLLKPMDVSAELTAVFSVDSVRDMVHQALAHAPPVPPQFQGFVKLPDLLSAVLLKVNIGQKFKASFTLRARDEAAGEEVETLVNRGLEMGRQAALAQLASMPHRGDDPVEEAGMKYMTRITDKIFALVKPVRSGQNVSVSFESGSSVATVGLLVALLLPAVQAAREAANRNTSLNKIRQIGLAMLNYESGKRHFPAQAIYSKDGKPLLSWRVAILPQIEEMELYKQFHLDEPWDSEHNKPLIAKMPAAYVKPGRPNDGTTVFLVPYGKGLAFEGTEGLTIGSFTDGTSKTILAVEVNDDRAVPWTKPDVLEVDLNKPFDGLGEAHAGDIFCAVFADCHTIGISKQCDVDTLKALFTRNGSEPIDDTLIR
jgi:hypothetical protein